MNIVSVAGRQASVHYRPVGTQLGEVMALREPVSMEALERAIRGRVAAEHGAESAFVTTPLLVKLDERSHSGSNWSFELPNNTSADCQNAYALAAEHVRVRLALATSRPALDLH